MADKTLSNPQIVINNTAISIVPNSLSFKDGRGDRTVRAQSAGGNSITVVVTEDATTKVSMVKIKLYNTQANFARVEDWQDATAGNTIFLSDGTWTKSFSGMFVTTDPDRAVGADGEVEIEFQGNPST